MPAKTRQLVVLSNGDPDILVAVKKHHVIPFYAVISVANAFKPHRATYETAAQRIGAARNEVLFAANHAFDCVGAKAAGMRTAFIDRHQCPFADWPYQPDLLLPNMTALAGALL